MAVDVKEYAAFTGVTEGYAEEILKDVEHAKWHMPSGAAKLEKAAELMADMEVTDEEQVVDPTDTPDAGAGEGTDTGDGADLDAGDGADLDAGDAEGDEEDGLNTPAEDVTETDPDGGSVEGEE